MTAQQHENGRAEASSTEAPEAAPGTFYAKKIDSLSDPYPYTAVRVEVRDGNFALLSVHWSAALALKEVGERLARGEQATAYLVRWDRIESENDPRLKETS